MRPTKLSEIQKEEIRKLKKEFNTSYAELAGLYGVSYQTISRICRPDAYEQVLENNRMYREANKEAVKNQKSASYQKRKASHRRYEVSFHVEKDSKVIEFLDNQKNPQNFIRQCIYQSLEKEK